MKSEHIFNSKLIWNKDFINDRKKSKNHKIMIADKEDLYLSAAKSFKGDKNLHNPEDLLLSSLTSCHMMSYLYCCQKESIEIIEYIDESFAQLEVYEDGSGKIIKATLNPVVLIQNKEDIETAVALHNDAKKLCFIANSCNFLIEYNPIVQSVL